MCRYICAVLGYRGVKVYVKNFLYIYIKSRVLRLRKVVGIYPIYNFTAGVRCLQPGSRNNMFDHWYMVKLMGFKVLLWGYKKHYYYYYYY